MKVVILAGGKGIRMSHLTVNTPKPLCEVGGMPILWHIMKIYNQYGLDDFMFLLGYKGEKIKEYFVDYSWKQSSFLLDMESSKIDIYSKPEPWKISFIDTGVETMTGGRIKKAEKYIGNETFMLTYGDGLADINISELLEFHKKQGKFVITVDTGYNTIEDVRYAKSLGIEVIVTDHHKTIKEKFDDEILYLNPKLSKTYKFQYLSGAGVAFKLAQGICMSLGLDMEIIYKYLDIVMIGTIADVVPMIDENRLIIKKGLKIIKNTKVKGLSYLLNYLRLNKKTLTTTDVSYYISPLINSLGRVGISRMGADFFLKDDDFDLYNIIEEMKEQNKQRRALEKHIFDDAMRKIKNLKIPFDKLSVIFLSSPKWHPGVIGVVSSRLAIKFNIPVVLVAIEGDYGKASCRSVGDISIFNLLSDVKNLLERYGGHDLAAGFVIHKENISKVKEYFINTIPKMKLEYNKNKKDYEKDFDIDGSRGDGFHRLLEGRKHRNGRQAGAHHSDDRQPCADAGKHVVRHAGDGHRFRAERQGRPHDHDDGGRFGVRGEQGDVVRRHGLQDRGFPLVRRCQRHLDALRLLSLPGRCRGACGVFGKGGSERRELHGFRPDRGREDGGQAHAVVHADDLQAQNVADRHQRDERIGFRHPGHRHQGCCRHRCARSCHGRFYGQGGCRGIRRDRQYGHCRESLLRAAGAAERCAAQGYGHHGRW